MLKFSRIINSDFNIIKRLISKNNEFGTEIVEEKLLNEVLSDNVEKDFKSQKLWKLYKSMPETVDDSLTSIILFPGQGSQFVGMGKNLLDHPGARNLYEVASQYLNRDILKLCLEGPAEKLNKTINCQPAIFTTSLASLQILQERNPELIENCVVTAGNSLGEISALVFAGAISFEQGLHFVRIRAEHMQKACDTTQGGLMTVFLAHNSDLKKAIHAAKLYCKEKLSIEDPVCVISTYLFAECKIIGGHIEALEFIETFAKDFFIKGTKRLNVAGAFHTPLMSSALPQCRNALTRIGTINQPKINVMSNVSGTIHTSANSIRRLLGQQVCRPVLWEQILMRLYMRPESTPFPKTVEIGPGTQLGQTVKRVNLKAMDNYMNLEI